MGKKVEKSLSKEKQANIIGHVEESDAPKSTEPYKCIGNFLLDFNELCKQSQMTYIPSVVIHPKIPVPQSTSSESKLDKRGDKKHVAAVSEPEVEMEQKEDGVSVEGPPKTYTTRDKLQYFKPSVQVELDNGDRWDTVTEVYVRGWKIDEPMMEVFHQCWSTLSKLHTINLWNTGLTAETLHTLATFLPKCPIVKNVILDGNSVKEENWSELLGDTSLIQNLSLRHCKITDKGVAGLGKALGTAKSTNTKLVSLNLAGNLIGDDGAEFLAEGLRLNRTLLSLILTSNSIGDRGATKISETLSRFSLTHEEVVVRRKLLSEKEQTERKSPPSGRKTESKDRPGSVSRSITSQDKTKQKPSAKKKDLKGKESKEDTKALKKDKEDTTKGAGKREARGSRGAQTNLNSAAGRTSSASVSTDIGKNTQGKTKDKKRDRGKTSSGEVDALESVVSESVDHINPLLESADYIDGQLWIAGNRMLINLNLSRNHIGETGMEALLKAIQYQTTLTYGNKGSGTGLLRLVISKNAVSPENETVRKINELMIPKDPFYKPQTTSESVGV